MKFHISPKDNQPKPCRAPEGQCPYRETSPHFETLDDANEYLTSGLSTFPKRDFKVSDFMDTDLLARMVKEGFVLERRHPKDPTLVILSYSKIAQITGKWNEATKNARGLMVRHSGSNFADALVVERPWSKFFTLSQIESGWSLQDEEAETGVEMDLDFDAPAQVFDKLDGSLGILYRAPDGLPALATKGSFDSDQANHYTKVLRAKNTFMEDSEKLLKQGNTNLFELVGPANRIILSYKKEDIILLGGSGKRDGRHISPDDLEWRGTRTERMPANSLREALALPPRPGREGMVVTLGDSMKVKIKQEDYLRLHRLLSAFSKKDARQTIQEMDLSYGDLLTLAKKKDVTIFPQIKEKLELKGVESKEDFNFITETRKKYFTEVLVPQAEKVKAVDNFVKSLGENKFKGPEAQKNFAAEARGLDFSFPTLMAFYQARAKGIDIKERKARNEITRAIKNEQSN